MNNPPHHHSKCKEIVRDGLIQAAGGQPLDIEIHHGEIPPPAKGVFQPHGYQCPHGITYWVLPTDRQISDWEAQQTP